MHEKKLKALAAKSFVAMFTVIMISFYVTKFNDSKIYVSAEHLNKELSESLQKDSEIKQSEYRNIKTGNIVGEIADNYIMISKYSLDNTTIDVKDLYMNSKLEIRINNLEQKVYSTEALIFSKEDVGMEEMSLEYEVNSETLRYCAIFDVTLDNIYVQTIYEDNEAFYIELKSPHEVYEKIIVIDAGHGGNDIGTASIDNKFYEKDINLGVVLELKELFDKDFTYKVYYTRLTDEKVYLNPRVNLVNKVKPDLFLSIHCNGSEYISAKGTEGLYGCSKENGTISSKEFATICVEEVSKALSTKVRSVIEKDDIYIIGNSDVPVCLIELGFMSNNEDMNLLKKSKNRKIAAEALYKAIGRTFEK